MEIWKNIYGFEGTYQISSYGNVRRKYKNGYKSLKPSNRKYYDVDLSNHCNHKRFAIHRLVALHFIPNPMPKYLTEVNHIDGNKHNNHVENLEWVSPSENVLHACTTLKHGAFGKTARPVNMIEPNTNKIIKTFKSVSEASREFKNTHARLSITFCCQGKYNLACGYKWQYAD